MPTVTNLQGFFVAAGSVPLPPNEFVELGSHKRI